MFQEVIAAIAVEAATYAIDKLYLYRVPDGLQGQVQVGSRVLVPFGFGNKRVEGIVAAFRKPKEEQPLKPVLEALDDTPVLTMEQLRLAAWMRERLYCTFYECIRLMLPAGLWFKRKETYTLAEGVDMETLRLRTGDEGIILQLFAAPGDSCSVSDIRAVMQGRSVQRVLDGLAAEGILVYHSGISQRSRDQSEQMYALDMDFTRAAKQVNAARYPARLEVLSLLADGGWMSRKELSYMTGASASMINNMVKRGWLRTRWEERLRTPDFSDVPRAVSPILSQEQQQAFNGLASLLDEQAPRAALLFGVTGSGKTSVYIRLIARALEKGRGAIMLVPEIGLTPQMLRQFAAQFGDTVAVLHSALSMGERYDNFKRIRSGSAKVVIGTRSAAFAPVENLGIIIMDEEQDNAYRSERAPRYHARDIVRYRAARESALLVFGSATPSIETYYGAQQGKYPIFTLRERFMGTPLPEVIIADMRGLAREGHMGMIGPRLAEELEETLDDGKQAILFLNRRGNSRVIGCGVCGWVPECRFCSNKLTYHSVSGRAMCHYCGWSIKITGVCPQCGAEHLYMETPGTQKVEEELHERFPNARVFRMDTDTMAKKNAHTNMLDSFAKGGADILLGTQMVTKGLDFENVTLVGVLDADQSLYASAYRARERTFALITQVAGRAGRRFDKGRAVIQTYSPEHPVILAAARQDYERFYESELATRQALLCPPAATLVVLTASGIIEHDVLERLQALKARLEGLFAGPYADLQTPILGPTPASTLRVMNRYRYYLVMRGAQEKRGRRFLADVVHEFLKDSRNRGISLSVDVNPDL